VLCCAEPCRRILHASSAWPLGCATNIPTVYTCLPTQPADWLIKQEDTNSHIA
jgi:hypothetical protein